MDAMITLILLSALAIIGGIRLNRIEKKNEEFDKFLEEITELLNRLSIEEDEED
jgi:hypothetical protein